MGARCQHYLWHTSFTLLCSVGPIRMLQELFTYVCNLRNSLRNSVKDLSILVQSSWSLRAGLLGAWARLVTRALEGMHIGMCIHLIPAVSSVS